MTLDHQLYGSKLKRGKTTFNPTRAVVCSRFSDSGEDAKVKGTRKKKKLAGRVSRFLNPLDSRTRTTTRTRFDLKFFAYCQKIVTPEFFIVLFFSLEK